MAAPGRWLRCRTRSRRPSVSWRHAPAADAAETAVDPDTHPAENRFRGVVERVTRGADAAEVVAALADGTRVSATLGLDALSELRFCQGDGVTVLISAFSVIVSAG